MGLGLEKESCKLQTQGVEVQVSESCGNGRGERSEADRSIDYSISASPSQHLVPQTSPSIVHPLRRVSSGKRPTVHRQEKPPHKWKLKSVHT